MHVGLVLVVVTCSFFVMILPFSAFAETFCGHDHSVCVTWHIDTSLPLTVNKDEKFPIQYSIDEVTGSGYVRFDPHPVPSSDGKLYLTSEGGGQVDASVSSSIPTNGPITAYFKGSKEGNYKIAIDAWSAKNRLTKYDLEGYPIPPSDTLSIAVHVTPEFP